MLKGVLAVEVLVERCAGLDVGKADLKACVRVPGARGRRQEIRTFATTTRELLELREWLGQHQVTVVGMEATGDYWKPVYYLLEDALQVQLLNAAHMHNVPGRKTDVSDSAWIARLIEHGLVRPSFVPPPLIRRLRDLTRYRSSLIVERTREKQRLDKVLEDALLTELPGGWFVSCGEIPQRVVSVRCHGRSSGYSAGSVVVGGAVSRVACRDGGSVRAVSAGGRCGWRRRTGRRLSS